MPTLRDMLTNAYEDMAGCRLFCAFCQEYSLWIFCTGIRFFARNCLFVSFECIFQVDLWPGSFSLDLLHVFFISIFGLESCACIFSHGSVKWIFG